MIQAPVVEEILFRGLIFGALCRWSRLLAYLLSGVVFILWHVSILWLVVRGEYTMDFGYARLWQPPVFSSHTLTNGPAG